MRSGRRILIAFGGAGALVFAAGLASPAAAQGLENRAWIEIGGFWPEVDTSIRIDNKNTSAPGTNIDLEQDLNLDDRSVLASIYGGWRLSEHWTLVGEYYSLNRSGTTQLARSINVDDVTYDLGATINSSFDTNVYRLGIGYAFHRSDRAEFGGVLGAHITDFKIDIAGQGRVGGASATSQVRKRDALAPLPTIGLYGAYAVTPKFIVGGRFDWLSLSVGDYDGRLTNTEVTAAYNFTDNFGAGVKYRYVDYNLGVDKNNWSGEAAYVFKGPVAYIRLGF